MCAGDKPEHAEIISIRHYIITTGFGSNRKCKRIFRCMGGKKISHDVQVMGNVFRPFEDVVFYLLQDICSRSVFADQVSLVDQSAAKNICGISCRVKPEFMATGAAGIAGISMLTSAAGAADGEGGWVAASSVGSGSSLTSGSSGLKICGLRAGEAWHS